MTVFTFRVLIYCMALIVIDTNHAVMPRGCKQVKHGWVGSKEYILVCTFLSCFVKAK